MSIYLTLLRFIITMFSTKELLWLSAMLFSLTCTQAQVISSVASSDEHTKGAQQNSCYCGGFPSSTPALDCEPLLSQSPGLVVSCDDEGAATCKELCLALATTTKAKGPEILCSRLKDVMNLKLSAFYKVCDKPWTYAGMTADEFLCCEDSKVKTCPSNENAAISGNMTGV